MINDTILISKSIHNLKIATLNNKDVVNIIVEKDSNKSILGSIYVGKIARIMNGMQAAFIDIGTNKNGYLHESEVVDDKGQKLDLSSINEGDRILVQVIKDPIGDKGPRLSTKYSISSKYLVYMPQKDGISISSKIEDEAERNRLKNLINDNSNGVGGYIVRTQAEGIQDLAQIQNELKSKWEKVKNNDSQKTGDIIYQDGNILSKTLRDLITKKTKQIIVDDSALAKDISLQVKDISKDAIDVKYYKEQAPLFEKYNVEKVIDFALKRRANLKSGGFIIIDELEAMTTIDVNTGTYVGKDKLEQTALNTNIEACRQIAKQLELRSIGGIIIVDFIDMRKKEHKQQLLEELNKQLNYSRVKSKVSEVTSLGLVQITRKRTRDSLAKTLCQSCPSCHGTGRIKSPQVICEDLLERLMKIKVKPSTSSLLVLASEYIIDRLLTDDNSEVKNIKRSLNIEINLQSEPEYSHEQFEIVECESC